MSIQTRQVASFDVRKAPDTFVGVRTYAAEITVNGTRLTNNEARMVRLALASFADIIANQLGFKNDGIPLTDQY
jgi:hypothetical protein